MFLKVAFRCPMVNPPLTSFSLTFDVNQYKVVVAKLMLEMYNVVASKRIHVTFRGNFSLSLRKF